ncbi:MAG: 16S rRNA (guanine(966)-N(2))-methyltransferase RsmD [Eubacteriales bacterium]
MRIITGTARGKRLKQPQGSNIRPTTDRVKESLFNIIQFEIPGRQVLDLFAGTGQLGLECLSRGAAGTTFVESSKEAQKLLRENIEITGFSPEVISRDALSFLSTCGPEKYDVILLDPPYETDLLEKSLLSIERFDILRNHGIIVSESPIDWEPPQLSAPYTLGKTYCYGKIKLSTFLKQKEI